VGRGGKGGGVRGGEEERGGRGRGKRRGGRDGGRGGGVGLMSRCRHMAALTAAAPEPDCGRINDRQDREHGRDQSRSSINFIQTDPRSRVARAWAS